MRDEGRPIGRPCRTQLYLSAFLAYLLALRSVILTSALNTPISFDALSGKRILVVGGSGRVGGSVVTQLIQRGSPTSGDNRCQVVVGGTSSDSFGMAQQRWMSLFPQYQDQLSSIDFVKLDREDATSILNALGSSVTGGAMSDFDLVIHTAGPFQGKVKCPNGVLEACIQANIPYMDVCDDYCTAQAAKTRYHNRSPSPPCILSTGCWPGVSSLMAKQLVSKTLAAYPKLKAEDLSIDFGFFTAGYVGVTTSR